MQQFDLNMNGTIDFQPLSIEQGRYTFYFDETSLTDQDILCYYTKTALFEQTGAVSLLSSKDYGSDLISTSGLKPESELQSVFEIANETNPCSEWPIFATQLIPQQTEDDDPEYYVYAGQIGVEGEFEKSDETISFVNDSLNLSSVSEGSYSYTPTEQPGTVDLELTLDGRKTLFTFLDEEGVEQPDEPGGDGGDGGDDPNNDPDPDPDPDPDLETRCCGDPTGSRPFFECLLVVCP